MGRQSSSIGKWSSVRYTRFEPQYEAEKVCQVPEVPDSAGRFSDLPQTGTCKDGALMTLRAILSG